MRETHKCIFSTETCFKFCEHHQFVSLLMHFSAWVFTKSDKLKMFLFIFFAFTEIFPAKCSSLKNRPNSIISVFSGAFFLGVMGQLQCVHLTKILRIWIFLLHSHQAFWPSFDLLPWLIVKSELCNLNFLSPLCTWQT